MAPKVRPLEFAESSLPAEKREGAFPPSGFDFRPGAKRPRGRRREAGATHPALPAVILIVSMAVFAAAIAPIDFTAIYRRYFPIQYQTLPHQKVAVWAVDAAGVYYCSGSILYGKAHGQYMQQVEALDRGYQPALGQYCTGPDLHAQNAPLPAAPAAATASKPPVPLGQNPFEQTHSQKQGTPLNPTVSH